MQSLYKDVHMPVYDILKHLPLISRSGMGKSNHNIIKPL